MGALRKIRLFRPVQEKPLQPLKLTNKFKEGDTAEVIKGKHRGKIVRVRFQGNGYVFVFHKTHNFHVQEDELKWISHSQT